MVGPLGFYTQKQAVAHPRVRFMGAAGTGKPERPPQAHPRAEHTEVTLCNMTHSHRMLLSVAPSRSLFCKLGLMHAAQPQRVSNQAAPCMYRWEQRAGSCDGQKPQPMLAAIRYGSFQPHPGFPPSPCQSNDLATVSCLSLKEKCYQHQQISRLCTFLQKSGTVC